MDRKSIFLALFIFIIIVFSLYFTLEENPIRPPAPAVENEELPEEELENVNFSIFNNKQQHELKLESKKMQNYKSEDRMELRPVEAEVYSTRNNNFLYSLTGDFATYYTNQEYIKINNQQINDKQINSLDSNAILMIIKQEKRHHNYDAFLKIYINYST